MIGLIAAAAVVVLFLLYLAGLYNRLVRRRNQVDNAWGQIDVQLKRRYDLIPNLVETVKGYASHERGIFEAVSQARARAVGAGGPRDAAEVHAWPVAKNGFASLEEGATVTATRGRWFGYVYAIDVTTASERGNLFAEAV